LVGNVWNGTGRIKHFADVCLVSGFIPSAIGAENDSFAHIISSTGFQSNCKLIL
jgi:hypothetical protein